MIDKIRAFFPQIIRAFFSIFSVFKKGPGRPTPPLRRLVAPLVCKGNIESKTQKTQTDEKNHFRK